MSMAMSGLSPRLVALRLKAGQTLNAIEVNCRVDCIHGATMRLSEVATFALIVWVSSLMSVSFARAASECSISTTLADWGENSTSQIDLTSGGSCRFPIRRGGTVSAADISQKPSHGKLKRINLSTFEYTAKARYKGSDTFAIKATGEGPTASGTSVITVNATIK